jgi:hypothetical protein
MNNVVTAARAAALQSLVSVTNLFELTDVELVDEAQSILGHHGLAQDEAGALLVAFNDLSCDERTLLVTGHYPTASIQLVK